ncbi:MAG: nucleotidyltransferase domain-containing protein [Verrucomicrobiota bacterium]|nr:nucleotidyltransferase domain-containing protein [Verrucomicrobiota bacterium]
MIGLPSAELELMRSVFRQHRTLEAVKLFGSRAKGTHSRRSDVDFALWGNLDRLTAEEIAAELDELPLPYRYDVQPFESIKLPALRDHIDRVGIRVYP